MESTSPSPGDKARGSAIGSVARRIDDEAETADLVLAGRDQKAPALHSLTSATTECGDHLNETIVVL